MGFLVNFFIKDRFWSMLRRFGIVSLVLFLRMLLLFMDKREFFLLIEVVSLDVGFGEVFVELVSEFFYEIKYKF